MSANCVVGLCSFCVCFYTLILHEIISACSLFHIHVCKILSTFHINTFTSLIYHHTFNSRQCITLFFLYYELFVHNSSKTMALDTWIPSVLKLCNQAFLFRIAFQGISKYPLLVHIAINIQKISNIYSGV